MTDEVTPKALMPSDDVVEFPDVFSDTQPPAAAPSIETSAAATNAIESSTANDTLNAKVEPQNATLISDTSNGLSEPSPTASLQDPRSNRRLCSSLRQHVKPGQSKRTEFPLVPSKVALLIIDIQDYLSSPHTIQEEEENAYFHHTALPQTVGNIEKLLKQTRRQRDEQSQGCEVVFTYLEALTQDCRDVSLDYKLSGPQLATLPNSPLSPAKFLETVQPQPRDGKGDILIPKTSCSVFLSTNLHYVLQNLHIEQLVVCGQLTDQCVESAVRDAADLGYFVTVVEDACAAKTPESHEKGLSGMKGFSRIVITNQVLDELQNPVDELIGTTTSLTAAVPPEVGEKHERTVPAPLNTNETTESSYYITIVPTNEWKVPTCNDDAVTTALLHTMQFAGVKFLRYLAVDACNSIRCKAAPLHHLQKSKRLDHQVAIAQVCFAGLPTFGDYMLESTELDASRILTVQPDIGTLRILPYAPSSAVVMGTAVDPTSNSVSPLCTRGLLSRVLETARQHGIEFVSRASAAVSSASLYYALTSSHLLQNVGAEIEFCLYKNGVPVDQSVFGNVTTMNEQEAFISDLDTQLQQQQIQVEQVHAESAPGQVELVLEYQSNAVRIADWVVLTRETIVAVANSHGMQAVFLPKLLSDKAGNGCHLHFSFRDTTRSRRTNAFSHATLQKELSAMGKSFVEGILRHLPALLSLTLPTNNSFRRVGPGCWTGSAIGWETEDKEAALRVCMNTCTGQWTNVEYKLCDSTANIYLALSGILACGLDGIVRNLALRPPIRQQQESSTLWDMQDKEATLPTSLRESLVCLREDEFLSQDVMGPELSKAYIAVRQAASEKFGNLTLEEEVAMALQ